MNNKEIFSEIVDVVIDSLAEGKNNNDADKAIFEWKDLPLQQKVKTMGIMSYYSESTHWLSMFRLVKKVESLLVCEDG